MDTVHFIDNKTKDLALEASKTDKGGIYFASDSLTIIHDQKEYSKTTIKNLDGYFTEDNATFNYRTSAGSQSIAEQANGDIAKIKGIYGNTIVWNQLVTTTFVSHQFPQGQGSTNTYIIQSTSVIPSGHKCYMRWLPTSNNTISVIQANINRPWTNTELNYNTLSCIVTTTNDSYLQFLKYGTVQQNAILEAYFQCFDLSLMFGLGKEPTLAQFEAWLAEYYPRKDYAYNAGTLVNVAPEAIKTIGFNLWDEEWEVGSLNSESGQNVSASNDIRSKNYIKVIGGRDYRITAPMPLLVFAYDTNKTKIRRLLYGSANVTKTIPTDAAYIKFATYTGDYTTYNNDICINLSWSGKRNGEYEPYWEETTQIDVKTLKGKRSDGTVEVMFPDGLKALDDVHDEIKGNKAIKRIGSVDLGSLTWTLQDTTSSDYKRFVATGKFIPSPKVPQSADVRQNLLCTKYTAASANNTWGSSQNDKIIALAHVASYAPMVVDKSYTDATSFKTAMQGVILYYELKTPIEYDLDTDFEIPYKCDDYGTEQILPYDENIPATLPIIADIQYGINVSDTLSRLPFDYVSTHKQDLSASEREQVRKNIGLNFNEDSFFIDEHYPDSLILGLNTNNADVDLYVTLPAADDDRAGLLTADQWIQLDELPNELTNIKKALGLVYTKKQQLAVYEEEGATMVVIDQSVSDPYSRILNPWNCPGHVDFDGDENNVIKWIKDNTHRYVGKFNHDNPADGLILVQLSDTDSSYLANGRSVNEIAGATYNGVSVGRMDFTTSDVLWDYYVVKPTFYYKTVNHGDLVVLYFAKTQLDNTYHKYDGSVRALGMMKGYVDDNNMLRSIPSVLSTNNTSQSSFITYATNRGQSSGAKLLLVDYEEHRIMALLYYAYYGDTNCQATIGTGGTSYPRTTGATTADGMNDSVKRNEGSINFFGIENWWGDLNEFMSGIRTIDSNGTIEITQYSLNGDTTRNVTNFVSDTDYSGNVIKRFVFGKNSDILATDVIQNDQTQNTSTYYCDYFYSHKGGGLVARRGGSSSNAAGGVGYLGLLNSPSDSNASHGSRLLYLGQIHYATLPS